MALETLKGVKEIGGFRVVDEEFRAGFFDLIGGEDWGRWDQKRKSMPIHVDHVANMISFAIQNGPIKEVGVNGCQLVTMIETAKLMLERLNEKFPCHENEETIHCLQKAIVWQNLRTKEREKRGVEGTSRP